ncbi:E7 [Gammapapillomavirus 7]|uniref:Protein E7 n=1 Tax=Gammapapillomavirus 7 TaxID=1175849 RepID=A0A2D2ALC8_9PAPI|nr:E7 [Gammapapillomavirus 7]
MHGTVANIKDIILEDINDLILPVNLLSGEDLSAEAELEPAHVPYKIVAYCLCGARLKFCVAASPEGIRRFQQLLLGELLLLCSGCSKRSRHGR